MLHAGMGLPLYPFDNIHPQHNPRFLQLIGRLPMGRVVLSGVM